MEKKDSAKNNRESFWLKRRIQAGGAAAVLALAATLGVVLSERGELPPVPAQTLQSDHSETIRVFNSHSRFFNMLVNLIADKESDRPESEVELKLTNPGGKNIAPPLSLESVPYPAGQYTIDFKNRQLEEGTYEIQVTDPSDNPWSIGISSELRIISESQK